MSQIDTALDIMLHNGRGVHEVAGKIYGVVPALVTAVNDTKGPKRHMLGMVEVYFPWLQAATDERLIRPWARLLMPNAGRMVGKTKKEKRTVKEKKQEPEYGEEDVKTEKKEEGKHYKISVNFAVGRPRAGEAATAAIFKDGATSENLAKQKAQQIASDYKAAKKGVKIMVDGLTSVTGSSGGNQSLSVRRADAIKEYIVAAGVPADIMTVTGHGEKHAGQMRDKKNPEMWIDNPDDAKRANCKAKAGDAGVTTSADECAACRRVDVTFDYSPCEKEYETKKEKVQKGVKWTETDKQIEVEVADPEPGSAGLYSPPQVGDEVLVAFEHGDPHCPFILGSLWNGKNTIPMPVTDLDGTDCPGHHPGGPVHKTPDLGPNSIGGGGGKNKIYFWRSRTGNLVICDDDAGVVRVCERSGNSVIQQDKGHIQILSKKGDLFIYAAKKIRFDCTKFEVHAKANILYEAGGDYHTKSDQHTTTEVKDLFSAEAKMKVLINSKKDINFHAQNGVDIKANLALQVKSGAKDQKIEAGKAFQSDSKMDTLIGTKDKLNVKAKSNVKYTSLMEITVVAGGGDINAKAGMIHMN